MFRTKLMPCALLAATLATAFPAAAVNLALPAPIVFDFDSSAQGWTVLYDGALVHMPTGGNPGGYLRLNDTSTATDFELLAPASLGGDRSAYLGGTLRFDARNLDVLPDWPDFGRITLVGAGLTLSVDGVAAASQPPADGLWHTYSVPLTTAVFGANLPTVLGQLSALSIKTEFHQGPEDVIDIDNIQLSPVPEAPRWTLMLSGLLAVPLLYRRRC